MPARDPDLLCMHEQPNHTTLQPSILMAVLSPTPAWQLAQHADGRLCRALQWAHHHLHWAVLALCLEPTHNEKCASGPSVDDVLTCVGRLGW